ncbi:hypothetical protein QVD99_006483 [Batrachochytrium dendrobatidis]|nr:hypothetical protein O5D80_002416 [Batrachochytrium dendrobatidis]KAK5666849.1 hypothetical protein QVD99_006483 [Batrachochytrium dendrobatidis]
MTGYYCPKDAGRTELALTISHCEDTMKRLDKVLQQDCSELLPTKCLVLIQDNTASPLIVTPSKPLPGTSEKQASNFDQWKRIRYALLDYAELLFQHIRSLYTLDTGDVVLQVAKAFVLSAHCQQIFKAFESCIYLAASWSCSGKYSAERRFLYSLINILQATKRVLIVQQHQISHSGQALNSDPSNLSSSNNLVGGPTAGINPAISVKQIEKWRIQTLLTALKRAGKSPYRRHFGQKGQMSFDSASGSSKLSQDHATFVKREANRAGQTFIWALNAFLDEITIMDQLVSSLPGRSTDDDQIFFEQLLQSLHQGKAWIRYELPSTEKLDEPNYEEDGCETPIKQKNDKDKNKDMVMSSIDTLAGETSPDHYKIDENSKDFPSSMNKQSQSMNFVHARSTRTHLPIAYRTLADHLVSLDELRVRSRLSLTDARPV